MVGGDGTERNRSKPGAFRPEAPVRTNAFTPAALVVHPDHVAPRRLPARNRDTCHVMHTGEPSCAAAGWPAIAAGLQRARIRAHAQARVRGNAGHVATQAAAHAGRGACGRRAGIASGPAHAFSADGKPVSVVDTARKFDPHEAARMWHRRCGNAGSRTRKTGRMRAN